MDVFIVLHLLFCSRRAVCLNVSVAPERMCFYCKCPQMTKPPCASHPAGSGLGHSLSWAQLQRKLQREWFILLLKWAKTLHPTGVTNQLSPLNCSILVAWHLVIMESKLKWLVISTQCLKYQPGNHSSGMDLWALKPCNCQVPVEKLCLCRGIVRPWSLVWCFGCHCNAFKILCGLNRMPCKAFKVLQLQMKRWLNPQAGVQQRALLSIWLSCFACHLLLLNEHQHWFPYRPAVLLLLSVIEQHGLISIEKFIINIPDIVSWTVYVVQVSICLWLCWTLLSSLACANIFRRENENVIYHWHKILTGSSITSSAENIK